MKYLLVMCLALAACGKPTQSDVYTSIRGSIARVWVGEGSGGSGFVVRAKSGRLYLATNAHVCDGVGVSLVVEMADTGIKYMEESVFSDTAMDLCLVTLTDQRHTPLRIGATPKRGEQVYSVGHPHLNALTIGIGHVVDYISIAIPYNDRKCEGGERGYFGGTCLREMPAINTNAISAPGSSGGPLLNARGEVVGVVFAGGRDGFFSLHPEVLKGLLSKY